jgi:deoxyribose-phosphate aldolase
MMDRLIGDKELLHHFELTLVRPEAMRAECEKLCRQAREFGAAAVVVNSSRVELARTLLEDAPVQVAAAINFPFGAADTDAKRYEVEVAVDNGAQELDVVLNHGWIKEGLDKAVLRELRDLVEAADERPLKAILDTRLLTAEEVCKTAKLAVEAGAHAVQLGTGMNGAECSMEDIKLVRAVLGDSFCLKAVALKLDLTTLRRWVDAGVTRVGVFLPE